MSGIRHVAQALQEGVTITPEWVARLLVDEQGDTAFRGLARETDNRGRAVIPADRARVARRLHRPAGRRAAATKDCAGSLASGT